MAADPRELRFLWPEPPRDLADLPRWHADFRTEYEALLRQLNEELRAIRARLDALENP